MNKYYGRKKYFQGKIKRINNTFSRCLVCGQDANRFSRMQLVYIVVYLNLRRVMFVF